MNALTDVGCTRSSSDRANQMVLLFRVSKLISPDQNNYADHKISITNIKIYDIYFFFLQSLDIEFSIILIVKYVLYYFIINHSSSIINHSLDFIYLEVSFSHYLRFI